MHCIHLAEPCKYVNWKWLTRFDNKCIRSVDSKLNFGIATNLRADWREVIKPLIGRLLRQIDSEFKIDDAYWRLQSKIVRTNISASHLIDWGWVCNEGWQVPCTIACQRISRARHSCHAQQPRPCSAFVSFADASYDAYTISIYAYLIALSNAT